MRPTRAIAVALLTGCALSLGACLANAVADILGEVGTPRAQRSGWAQTGEFASLVLDSGWGWAATAVAVGWLVSGHRRPVARSLVGAASGGLTLLIATPVYYLVESLLTGSDFYWGPTQWYWLAVGAALGLPLGAVGATIRHPGLPGRLASLAVPAGASLSMALFPPPDSNAGAVVKWTVWSAAAFFTALTAVRATRSRRHDTSGYPVAVVPASPHLTATRTSEV